jgi:hypothetical protein
MTGLADMQILDLVRQRSLRAESPQIIAGERPNPLPLPDREIDFTLVQSKLMTPTAFARPGARP